MRPLRDRLDTQSVVLIRGRTSAVVQLRAATRGRHRTENRNRADVVRTRLAFAGTDVWNRPGNQWTERPSMASFDASESVSVVATVASVKRPTMSTASVNSGSCTNPAIVATSSPVLAHADVT